MDSALIISGAEKSTLLLTEFLLEASVSSLTTVVNAGEARRLLINDTFDLCVINTPLSDEFGESLARSIAEAGNSEVILLVKSELYDDISGKVEDYGIITVCKPMNKILFWNAVKLAQATHKKIRIIQRENQRLLQKIEDIRIVDRAKCILISHLSMTEPEAHKYIEKQAMDMRLTRREVAENILKIYEN